MLKPRFYMLLLRKGIPAVITFVILGMYIMNIPLLHGIEFMIILLLSVLSGYWVSKIFFLRVRHESTCYRFRFVIKESFYKTLRIFGIPVTSVLLVGAIYAIGIPLEYAAKSMFILIFVVILEYNGIKVFYRHFTSIKNW